MFRFIAWLFLWCVVSIPYDAFAAKDYSLLPGKLQVNPETVPARGQTQEKNNTTSTALSNPVWIALYLQTPVRSIYDGKLIYRTRTLEPVKADTVSYMMEFRSAANMRESARVQIKRTPECVLAGYGYFTNEEYRKQLTTLPDGEYRVAILANGVRCSNVAALVVDSKLDISKEPVIKVTPLHPWPEEPLLPLLGIQVTGPYPQDANLTNYAVDMAMGFYVDGVQRTCGIKSWAGCIRPLNSGETELASIIDPNPAEGPLDLLHYDPWACYPAIDPVKPHKFTLGIGKHSTHEMELKYTGKWEEEWDAVGK